MTRTPHESREHPDDMGDISLRLFQRLFQLKPRRRVRWLFVLGVSLAMSILVSTVVLAALLFWPDPTAHDLRQADIPRDLRQADSSAPPSSTDSGQGDSALKSSETDIESLREEVRPSINSPEGDAALEDTETNIESLWEKYALQLFRSGRTLVSVVVLLSAMAWS